MKFSPRFAPWEAACPAKDTSRPILNACNVKRVAEYTHNGTTYNAELSAADGYILAVVPCILEDGEPEGTIDVETLKAAVKLAKNDRGDAWVVLEADRARLADGTSRPRVQAGTFPDYHRIAPDRELNEYISPSGMLAANPSLVLRLAKALDAMEGMTFQVVSPDKPILVDCLVGQESVTRYAGRPSAPYGVLMPMHMDAKLLPKSRPSAAAAA